MWSLPSDYYDHTPSLPVSVPKKRMPPRRRTEPIPLDRLVRRSYTSEEMNRGDGMEYHPENGMRLSKLIYDERYQCYLIRTYLGFGFIHIGYRKLCRIGDDANRKPGFLYLSHWQFDPFTGAKL